MHSRNMDWTKKERQSTVLDSLLALLMTDDISREIIQHIGQDISDIEYKILLQATYILDQHLTKVSRLIVEGHHRSYDELRRNQAKEGYVYIARILDGIYKIGRSSNPQKRCRDLTRLCRSWTDVELVHLISSKDMVWCEREIHRIFDNHRADVQVPDFAYEIGVTELFTLDNVSMQELVAIKELNPQWFAND